MTKVTVLAHVTGRTGYSCKNEIHSGISHYLTTKNWKEGKYLIPSIPKVFSQPAIEKKKKKVLESLHIPFISFSVPASAEIF